MQNVNKLKHILFKFQLTVARNPIPANCQHPPSKPGRQKGYYQPNNPGRLPGIIHDSQRLPESPTTQRMLKIFERNPSIFSVFSLFYFIQIFFVLLLARIHYRQEYIGKNKTKKKSISGSLLLIATHAAKGG